MNKYKPRELRLIDVLGAMDDRDYAVIMFNNGTASYSNCAKNLRTILDDKLGCKVIKMFGGSGGITILLNVY